MESHHVISSLLDIIAKMDKELGYIGPPENFSQENESSEIEILGYCEEHSTLTNFSYLDSSSRMITIKGVRVYMGSLFMSDPNFTLAIPQVIPTQFLALKASSSVLENISRDNIISSYVKVTSPAGIPYDQNYKDDNISDELRISLENYAISKSSSITIVDGPVIPGPNLTFLSEEYKSAFEKLINDRVNYFPTLIGVVKRLDMSYKLSKVKEFNQIIKKFSKIRPPDTKAIEIISQKGEDPFITPILKENWGSLVRYMVYVKVRNSVFRVESTNLDILCKGVNTTIDRSGVRGIPDFIEIADRISKRLSASIFILSFILGSKIGVSYDDWGKFWEASEEIREHDI
ncbi:nuclease NurA [Candidatus Acidianus copahuensis]|uniref:Nuclease NurA n=1 Tax=Candidatus Acidianus copahuensis TaxID=1160895 RepID=A0A031LQH0_9CREN|nr:DNA double-strand break repair nuclease NurA [Candidatus Acidianus copahuensis]EZQ10592.1 nuclease NurA [Candidatus Acidianus copahuensis]